MKKSGKGRRPEIAKLYARYLCGEPKTELSKELGVSASRLGQLFHPLEWAIKRGDGAARLWVRGEPIDEEPQPKKKAEPKASALSRQLRAKFNEDFEEWKVQLRFMDRDLHAMKYEIDRAFWCLMEPQDFIEDKPGYRTDQETEVKRSIDGLRVDLKALEARFKTHDAGLKHTGQIAREIVEALAAEPRFRAKEGKKDEVSRL